MSDTLDYEDSNGPSEQTLNGTKGKRPRSETEQYGCRLCGEPLLGIDEAIDHIENEHGKDLEEDPTGYLMTNPPKSSEIQNLSAAIESPVPLDGKRAYSKYSKKYGCTACSRTNNNYEIMINHMKKHHVSECAKLIVKKKTNGDESMPEALEKLNAKMAIRSLQDQENLASKPVQSDEETDSHSHDSIGKPESSRSNQSHSGALQKERDDCMNDLNFTSSELGTMRNPFQIDKDKISRLIEKQHHYIEDSIVQLNKKSSSLDKKADTMTTHIDNVNTRLDFMDNRLNSIEQKLAKLMRLVENS